MATIAIGEAFEEAIRTMEDYVEEVGREIEKLFDELHELAVKENKWEVLYETAKGLENQYNEEVLEEIKKEIGEWAESDGSYVALCKRFKMGKDAEGEARKQQNEIVDKITGQHESDKLGETPDFSNTSFDTEEIKKRLGEIAHNTDKIRSIAEEKDGKLKELSEDNESVRTLVSVGLTYGQSIANFVTEVTKEISDFLADQIDNINKDNTNSIDAAVSKAEKFNEEIKGTTDSMKNILADLFS